nr:DUF1893 domain-containing protein [Muribaculaceae bacterium]
MEISPLIDILDSENCSCVIANGNIVKRFYRRGVTDLLQILKSEQSLLAGAAIADKVIGKGAAAIMILGGARHVYGRIISQSALTLLGTSSVTVTYDKCVPAIINRAGTGICPVETLCKDCKTAADCLPLIETFVAGQSDHQQS